MIRGFFIIHTAAPIKTNKIIEGAIYLGLLKHF